MKSTSARRLLPIAFAVGAVCAFVSNRIASLGSRAPDQTSQAPQTTPALDPVLYHHVAHLVWVVGDLDQVAAYWRRLGIQDTSARERVIFPDLTYRGGPDPASADRIVGHVGDLEIEWIQPAKGGRFWSDGLRAHGDGIRVLGYTVRSPQEFDDQIGYFASKGAGVVAQATWMGHKGRGRFAYLDTALRGGGLTIGLIDDPDAHSAETVTDPNEYPLTKITHYAWVVRDVRAVDAFYTSLGFRPFSNIDHNISLDRVYRGKPGSFEMWLGWDRTGDAPFEWVQQITGPDVYVEYIEKHGEGFHHLGVNVSNMDEAIKLMTARGAPASQTAAWNTPRGKGRAAYLDSESLGGVTLELIYDPPRPN